VVLSIQNGKDDHDEILDAMLPLACPCSFSASDLHQPHADLSTFTTSAKPETYRQLLHSLESLLEGQRNWVANLANTASLLWHLYQSLPPPSSSVNWTGFYILDPSCPSKQLILGPFMGKVACQTIDLGKGVCGTAARGRDGSGNGETLVVSDVERFDGHIACDGDTRSEIVVPIRRGGKVRYLLVRSGINADERLQVVGVIDIDCTELNGFDEEDRTGLEAVAGLLGASCDWQVGGL
jgi:L-methionine (R)-S-oxide reductase